MRRRGGWVYWWTPETGRWIAQALPVRGDIPPVIAGEIGAAVSPGRTGQMMNLFGRAENYAYLQQGWIARLMWEASDGGLWRYERV